MIGALLARWRDRLELRELDELEARERCAPLTDTAGNRERLIRVRPREAPREELDVKGCREVDGRLMRERRRIEGGGRDGR